MGTVLFKNKKGQIIVPLFEELIALRESAQEPKYYIVALEFDNRDNVFSETELMVADTKTPGIIANGTYIFAFDENADIMEYFPNWEQMVVEQINGLPMSTAIEALEMNFNASGIIPKDASHMFDQLPEQDIDNLNHDYNYIAVYNNPNTKSEYWLDEEPPPPMPISLN